MSFAFFVLCVAGIEDAVDVLMYGLQLPVLGTGVGVVIIERVLSGDEGFLMFFKLLYVRDVQREGG